MFAHNAKGYDSYFIMDYLVRNGLKPYTIYNGNKLMLLEIPKLKIKMQDSLNLLPIPLKDFAKTFGIEEIKKGYFPHYFNKPENYNYKGKLPPKEDYGYDNMREKDRKDFLKWYIKNVDKEFDFMKELKEYCDSDVNILRRGLLELRKNFLEIVGVDPLQYLTIASVCMAIYRNKDMSKDSIGIMENDAKDQI